MYGRQHIPPREGPEARCRATASFLVLVAVSLSWAGPTRGAPPSSPALAPLAEVAPTIVQEIRYAGPENFVGVPIDGYGARSCWLTPAAGKALAKAQRAVEARGLSLKVYDCYRPQRAVNHFVRWARDLADTRMKSAYYPAVPKTRLFAEGYIAAKSGHSRGSTVDLTLTRGTRPMPTGGDCRAPTHWGDELPMGTAYDCFDPLSHTDNPKITGEARRNRLSLRAVMERHGFVNYSKEWWHYTLADEPHPSTYFDQPIR
jgi:D-alanyl-D-alanine dipeptidase